MTNVIYPGQTIDIASYSTTCNSSTVPGNVRVKNTSLTSTLTNIDVTFTIPSGLQDTTPESLTAGTTYNPSTHLWEIPSLAAGSTAEINTQYIVQDDSLGPYIIEAEAVVSGLDVFVCRQIDAIPCSVFGPCAAALPPYTELAATADIAFDSPYVIGTALAPRSYSDGITLDLTNANRWNKTLVFYQDLLAPDFPSEVKAEGTFIPNDLFVLVFEYVSDNLILVKFRNVDQ